MPKMEPFKIKIYVKGTTLEVNITSSDPENLLVMAVAITEALRKNGMEPTVEFQP